MKITKKKELMLLVEEIERAFLRERSTNEFYKNLNPIIKNGKEKDDRHTRFLSGGNNPESEHSGPGEFPERTLEHH